VDGWFPKLPAMPDLEQLSSKELHDLAVSRARSHADLKFFWDLLKFLPVAEAGAGKLDEAEADLSSTIAHVNDITDSGEGEVADLLRPFYLDYLQRHEVEAP
jgi:hypothetical protein